MAKKDAQIYQIKVSLNGVRPAVWRRFLVPGSANLLELHDILQVVMGWEDEHLHLFAIESSRYSLPEDGMFGALDDLDESRYRLEQVIQSEGQRFTYVYDFGDSWEHSLVVEKILPAEPGERYPVCLAGKRACPPEDVGGIGGYHFFLKAIQNPRHPEHRQYREWIGEEFDPEAFDLEEVNRLLRLLTVGRAAGEDAWSPELGDELQELYNIAWQDTWQGVWENAFGSSPAAQDLQAAALDLPLRRDVLALLEYLQENKVTGTKSTGNFPLKAVAEICARFVDPPQLEETFGDKVSRVRSEREVWPLYFRHALASTGGLIRGGMGWRWKLTALGESFLAEPALRQVWFLLAVWWTRTNWTIAAPYFDADIVPMVLINRALEGLVALQPGEDVSFSTFADGMLPGLSAGQLGEEHEISRLFLHTAFEQMIISPNQDFGVLTAEFQPHPVFGDTFEDLVAFRLTPFGKRMLEMVQELRYTINPDQA